MNETNIDWDDLRLFLAVARQGGLAAAADSSGKSAPTLGRRMLALERRLGKDLFERLPRGYVLTDQGQQLLQIVENIQHSIEPFAATKNSANRRVKISAGTWTTQWLCQQISELIHDNSVTLQFISANHDLDISHREAVIGIRNKRPTHPSLAVRQTRTVNFAIYAANTDVKTWAISLGHTPSARWVRENVDETQRVEITDPRTGLDMAIAGLTKVVLPTFVGNSTSGLVQISENIKELEHKQWLVTHHEERHLPEVRQVLNKLHKVLSESTNQLIT